MTWFILLQIVFSTFIALILGLLATKITLTIAIISLLLGTIFSGIFTFFLKKQKNEFPEYSLKQLWPPKSLKAALGLTLIIFVSYVALQHFIYLFYYFNGQMKTLHANNFGDLCMHIQYIRHMSSGAPFWPVNPEFPSEILRYPLGIDLYSSLWEAIHIPTDSHLLIIGFILSAITIISLFWWIGWFGVGAFFLNGGIANYANLLNNFHKRLLMDYQNQEGWKNFFLSLWITQRGFLFALPAGVAITKLTIDHCIKRKTLSSLEKSLISILWAALPLFHLHTFFILSIFLAAIILWTKNLKSFLWTIIAPVIIGFIFVWHSTNGFQNAGIVHLQWNWVAANKNFFLFWFINLGPWILFWLVSLFLIFKKKNSYLRPIAWSSWTLFFTFTWVMVAPWDWDNIKVLMWCYLLIVWVIWEIGLKNWQGQKIWYLAFFAFYSGYISLLSSLPTKDKAVNLISMDNLAQTQAAIRNLPIKFPIFASYPSHNQAIAYLGQKQAIGFEGHLWSHGLKADQQKSALDHLMKGDSNWKLSGQEINIDYIFWGPEERLHYGQPPQAWAQELLKVYNSPSISIFQFR